MKKIESKQIYHGSIPEFVQDKNLESLATNKK
jgi:hypothetical protein